MSKDLLINDMLKNIPDPRLREQYGRIISGSIAKQVKCLSKVCKGHVIAHIDDQGRVTETPPIVDPKGKYGLYKTGLEGSRMRFDGQYGFRCYCGNNSILCDEEKGIITPAQPTEQDLITIAERLSKRTKMPTIGPRVEVDGFMIEELRI